MNDTIPKTIVTVWLSENPLTPLLIRKCIASQNIPGYNHHLITLENCNRSSKYVRECLAAEHLGNRRFVKASDYLRVQYLYEYGGIHMDADMEMLPGKNFDDLLNCKMFTSRECAGLLANAAFGAQKGHPFLKEYMRILDENFIGSGELVFEPGIRAFDDLYWKWRNEGKVDDIVIVGSDYFFPYDHRTGEMKMTENTRLVHHYNSVNNNGWK